jgi:hypothetical protein
MPRADSDDMRLHGRWLLAARLGWLALAAIILALNAISLPTTFTVSFTPQELVGLQRANFSPTLFAAIILVENGSVPLAYLALALLLWWARSDERIALFGATMLLAVAGIIGGGIFNPSTGDIVPILATPLAVAVVAHLMVVIAQSSLIIFFYLFPSGRFVPRWSRWCALLILVYWLVVTFMPRLFNSGLQPIFLAFFLSALVAQVYRYRRVSIPVQREQTKWIVFGVVVAVLIIVVPQVLISMLTPASQDALFNASVPFALAWGGRWQLALLLIPVSITIAILRSHLWDIDVIINRALVYGLLTTLLATVYFGGVYSAQVLLNTLVPGQAARQSPVLIVAFTLLIAALFTPLRRRLQAAIDRRFYRRKYDAARTLATFGATLRAETDVETLRQHLVGVVHQTMQPAHVSLWLRSTQRQPTEDQPHHMEPPA